MSEFSQTVPELVAWARKNDFSLSLPVDRLSFLLAVATLNSERLDGEMSEGELVDAFRHVSDAFEQTSETINVRANNAINDMVRRHHRLLHSSARILDPAPFNAALHCGGRTEAGGRCR